MASRYENDRTWEERGDREYDRFTAHPVRTFFKWVLILVALCAVLGLIIGACNWIGSWGSTGARLTSPQHTEEQTTAVLDDWTKLQAAACNAKGAKDSKQQSGDPTLIEDPALAYKATYRSIKADYDRRMNNLFEAAVTRHIPLPDTINNLPRFAPSLHQAEQEFC